MRSLVAACALALFIAGAARAVPIAWNTDADGSWNDATNWDVGVPGPTDDVSIDRGAADPTVTHGAGASSVASLLNEEDLVVNGGSLDTGAFTSGSSSSVTVDGSGVRFAASGATSVDGASLFARDGGLLDLSAATSYASVGERTIRSTAGSIDLSSVVDLTGSPNFRQELIVEALAGGTVDLGGVTDLGDTSFRFRADGAGSEIDLSGIGSFIDSGTSFDISRLEARNGGALLLSTTQPLTIQGYSVTLEGAASTLDTSRLTTLTDSTLTATGLGATFDLSSLTSFDGNSFIAESGATLTILGTSYAAGAGREILRASGSDMGVASEIVASSLTSLSGSTVFRTELEVEALAGGFVDLSNVMTLADSSYIFRADGADSLLDLSSVASFSDTGTSFDASIIEASNGGTLRLTNATTIAGYTVRIDGGATSLDTSGITSLTNSTAEALGSGATLDLSSLASFDGNSFLTSSGASLALLSTSYASGAGGRTLRASGSDGGTPSTIDGTLVTALSGSTAPNSELLVETRDGGFVDLSNVASLADSSVRFLAGGTDSEIDLSSLTSYVDTGSSVDRSSIEASNGGTVRLSGSATSVDGYTLRIRGAASTLDTAQVTSLTNSTAHAIGLGASLDFSSLADFDGNSFLAEDGALLELTTSSYDAGSADRALRASGTSGATASRINGSAITSLVGAIGGPTSELNVEARAGGFVDLSGLAAITGGKVLVSADGAGSVVDLTALTSFVDTAGALGASSLQASNGGQVQLSPGAITALTDVDLHASSTGMITGQEVQLLTGSRVIGEGSLDLDLTNELGTLAPGIGLANPANILLSGDYVQAAGGTLAIEIEGLLSLDFVEVAGTASLGGAIELSFLDPTGGNDPFDPEIGDSFDVLTAAQIVDAGFDITTGFSDSRFWTSQILSGPSGDTLRFSVAVPEPSTSSLLAFGLVLWGARRRR